ncbi:MAG: 5-formyltetrahydrofolate cyclo-ligase [Verrucomicrobiae bacterium]|nr:5-formyltetrahydrofolate cyclo-ligase [Verrucomicrobiae bacterium]
MELIQREKRQLRRELRSRLGKLSQAELAEKSARICAHLRAFLPNAVASPLEKPNIGAFAALPGEADLMPLMEADPPMARWCFPLVQNEGMQFHAVLSASNLIEGSYGIREPDPASVDCAIIPIEKIDCFLVPGLGFSATNGQRLGRGKGFYDRCLANARESSPRIGVTFDSQLVNALPFEAHDLPVHFLVTESGIREIAGSVADQ